MFTSSGRQFVCLCSQIRNQSVEVKVGFINSLFKDHLRTDRELFHAADKLRRDLFHPKEDKPAETAAGGRAARVATEGWRNPGSDWSSLHC